MTNQSQKNGFRQAAPYMSLGWQIMISMVFFTGLGYYADEYFDTRPLLFIVGAIFGAGGVAALLYKLVVELDKTNSKIKP